jgi:hypothetical protein
MTAALLLVLPALLPLQGDAEWPAPRDPRSAVRGRLDLYNLGLLGAKARDADVEPRESSASGGSVQLNPDDPVSVVGPDRLRVEVLLPGGPGEEAGLAAQDVIVGVGSKSFDDDSFEKLTAALAKAAAGGSKGIVKLRVEREGEKGVLALEVAVPELGKKASKPTSDAGLALYARPALDWLAGRQREDGGFPATLSGRSGAVVQTSLAGLAWLAGGSSLEEGPHAENLARIVPYLRAFIEDPAGEFDLGGAQGSNWNQDNWGFVHAGIFLGELQERAPSEELLALLQQCADAILARQEESGGWAHGPGGPNALGYVELNIVTGLALSALGVAKRAGCAIPDEPIERAVDFIDRSSGAGVGYSPKAGQAGQGNIGRTAATWLGYQNLGLSREGKKFGSYVESNAGDFFGGHASLMQHILLAGVGSAAKGGKARKSFLEAAQPQMILARAPDGSFQSRPWHETISTGSNSDVTFGEVWCTAAWAIALLAPPSKDGASGLPAWCGD